MKTSQRNCSQAIFYIFLLLILSACSSKTTVILLPEADGSTGLVTVTSQGGATRLSQAGATTEVSGSDSPPKPVYITDKKSIDKRYGKVLETMPAPPLHFLLYFQKASTILTKASADTLPDILLAIKKRNSEDISVIGHTDTAGDSAYNYSLSKNRAWAVAQQLKSMGISEEHIDVTSHGEQNLLIQTADNVHQQENRRVEVVIR